MITRTRLEHVPSNEETVTFGCTAKDGHDADCQNKAYTFTWPGYYRNYEIMTPNSTGSRKDWKDFEHFRSRSGSYSNSLTPIYTEKWRYYPHVLLGWAKGAQAGAHLYWSGSELAPYGSLGSLNQGLPTWHVEDAAGHFVPEPNHLDKLIADALRQMLPGIKAELSLLNSIVELKDFKSYRGLAKHPLLGIQNSGRAGVLWAKLALAHPRACISELIRKTAGNFLSWKLAFKPLLSDITAVYTALSRTEGRMNDLVTRAGRVQKRHFRCIWNEYENSYEKGNNPGNVWWPYAFTCTGLYDVDRTVTYSPTSFHAEIEYCYHFTRYQLEHARVLSLLDAFGVNLNPAVIWNAIPWTFIIDWVIGVNRWLDGMKSPNMEPMINIRRFLWSVKRERRIIVTKGLTRTYYGLPPYQRNTLPVVTETAYRRQVGLPDMNTLFESGISSDEMSVGGALLITRKRRRYNYNTHFNLRSAIRNFVLFNTAKRKW